MKDKESTQTVASLKATPNPVPYGLGLGSTTVTWDVGDDSVGQVYVSTNGGPEKLFTSGSHGSQDAPWISANEAYEFRLYAGTDHTKLLSEVVVTRSAIPWELLSAEMLNYASQEGHSDKVARLLADIIPRYLKSPAYQKYFRTWEKHGFHLTPVHFYQPIPDTRTLSEDLWAKESELAGIAMNDEVQLQLLQEAFPRFKAEYDQFPLEPSDRPHEFYHNNPFFNGIDALVLYCMVRHFQPIMIIEVGSGFSSRVSAQAAQRNDHTELFCIEPYPDDMLSSGFPGLTSLVPKTVQEVGLDLFQQLGANDILFIDSSHVARCGGDVNYLFFEVLPRLRPGVIVHVHDIFFPKEYPEFWVKELLRFWNEQYLLQAFLSFNSEYEVLLCNSYLAHQYKKALKTTFPNSPPGGGSGSFWMRRKLP